MRAAIHVESMDPVRDDLVALVLEVVLGEPERVVAEPLGLDRRVDVLLGRPPRRVVVEAPVHRCRRAGAGVVDLDAAEEERPELHRPYRRVIAATILRPYTGRRLSQATLRLEGRSGHPVLDIENHGDQMGRSDAE